MEVLTARGNDPIYKPIRTAFGVEDKDKFVSEARMKGNHPPEGRSKECMVCPKGERKEAILDLCEVVPGIECNCCEEHRKNCVLK